MSEEAVDQLASSSCCHFQHFKLNRFTFFSWPPAASMSEEAVDQVFPPDLNVSWAELMWRIDLLLSPVSGALRAALADLPPSPK
jgi:hypothetical protein